MTYTRIYRIPRVIHLHIHGADPYYPCIRSWWPLGWGNDWRQIMFASLPLQRFNKRTSTSIAPFHQRSFSSFRSSGRLQTVPAQVQYGFVCHNQNLLTITSLYSSKFCLYAMSLCVIRCFVPSSHVASSYYSENHQFSTYFRQLEHTLKHLLRSKLTAKVMSDSDITWILSLKTKLRTSRVVRCLELPNPSYTDSGFVSTPPAAYL